MASSSSSLEEEEKKIENAAAGSVGTETAGNPAADREGAEPEIKKKKKKVLLRMPQHEVDFVLSYESMAAARVGGAETGVKTMLDEFIEINDPWMLAQQRDYRQQMQTKGYVTHEVLVTDDEDDAVAGPRPRGRRRFRPGVMRRASGHQRKLN